jgi:hypothetical protein
MLTLNSLQDKNFNLDVSKRKDEMSSSGYQWIIKLVYNNEVVFDEACNSLDLVPSKVKEAIQFAISEYHYQFQEEKEH